MVRSLDGRPEGGPASGPSAGQAHIDGPDDARSPAEPAAAEPTPPATAPAVNRAQQAASDPVQGPANGPSGQPSEEVMTRAARLGRKRKRKDKKPDSAPVRFLKDAVFVVVAALILSFLLKTFLIQSFYIPSESMEPTLETLDRVLVTKLAPKVLDVHRGDVVVFENPGGWVTQMEPMPHPQGLFGPLQSLAEGIGLAPADSKDFLIKRVIGLPGDQVACEGDGAPVTVNGVPLDETYIAPGGAPSGSEFSVVVPDGALWVMGDNRDHSADSRSHMDQELGGAVALDDVVGIAQVRTWPLDRFTLLRNPGQVFSSVPPANGGGR